MFGHRLKWAWAAVAVIALLQGLVAAWAIRAAAQQVERGRVSSDFLLGLQTMAVAKLELRQAVVQGGVGARPDALGALTRLQRTLELLHRLARRAQALEPGGEDERAAAVHQRRADTLLALDRATTQLAVRLQQQASAAGMAPDPLGRAFELEGGDSLRRLLVRSEVQERETLALKRAAADRSLGLLGLLALLATGTLVALALALAWYFQRALRAPLQRLESGTQALQQGRLDHRIPEEGDDEFARLARRVNLMAEELQQHRQKETGARQRLESLVQQRTAELGEALSRLQGLDARRRQLFADISHELRTPTTAIRGEAEIALRGADKPAADYRATLQRVAEASRHLGGVIDDLLALARAEIDVLSVQREGVDGPALLAEAVRQAQALGASREVAVLCDMPDPPPASDWTLRADPRRLHQLFMLLLDNAVQYSRPGGRVWVQARRSGPLPAGPGGNGEDRWEVQVRDEGIGIEPHELALVFERHFRGEAARRHRADGSGLGLALARALAHAHQGELRLHSTPGRGTTATLNLPVPASVTLADGTADH